MWTSDSIAEVTDKLQRWLALAEQGEFALLLAEHDDLTSTLIAAAHEPKVHNLALELSLKMDATMRWNGHWHTWHAVLMNLLLAAQGLNRRDTQALLWERIGALLTLRGDHPRAAAAHHTARHIVCAPGSDNPNSNVVGAWALAGLIDDARRRDALDEALQYVPFAIIQARHADDCHALANVYTVSANVYGQVGDLARAFEYAQMGYVYWHCVDDQVGIAKTLHILGIIYQMMGRLHQAMHVTQRAAAIYQAIGSDYLSGLLNILLGNLYDALDDWPSAERHYHLAVQYLESQNATFDMAIAHQNLGLALLERERWKEAEHHLLGTLEIWHRLRADGQCVRTLYSIGDMYARRGSRRKAARYWQETLEMAKRMPSEPRVDDIIVLTRECLDALNGAGRK